MQYELFVIFMKYYIEGLRYYYRKENEELRKNLAAMTVMVREYEKKFGKLFGSPTEKRINPELLLKHSDGLFRFLRRRKISLKIFSITIA